ncbi:MAG TPA: DUF3570 domain-containing protein [Kofleriaceae bacterium]|nr:DUF3570 domain-containing protein [Kofleriaceae bacterium]
MQLTAPAAVALAIAGALTFLPRATRADGDVTVRGAYYKERSTRVIQPMADWRMTAGQSGEVTGHVLVDSITSASVSAGAAGEPFSEKRYELGAGYAQAIGRFLAGGSARYSTEPDYQSIFATLRGQAELFRKNTVVTVAVARGHDNITNAGAQGGLGGGVTIDGQLDTTLGSVGVTQILSPELVGGLTYDLIYLDGFQENPYRRVAAGGEFHPERVPDTRLRHAIAGSLRGFIPATDTTLFAAYRLYHDDWGITAHTPEAGVIQEIKPGIEIAGRYRYYFQTDADFYKPIYDTADPLMEPYITEDDKLSALTTHTVEVEVSALLSALGIEGDLGQVRVDASAGYLFQSSHYGNAVIGQFAIEVPFEAGL